MYVKYCENKPKSEFLVAEYFDFFEVRMLKLRLCDQLGLDLMVLKVCRTLI